MRRTASLLPWRKILAALEKADSTEGAAALLGLSYRTLAKCLARDHAAEWRAYRDHRHHKACNRAKHKWWRKRQGRILSDECDKDPSIWTTLTAKQQANVRMWREVWRDQGTGSGSA